MRVQKESREKPTDAFFKLKDFSPSALLQKKKTQAPFSLKPTPPRPIDHITAQSIAAEPAPQKAKGESMQWCAEDQLLINWFKSYMSKLNDVARNQPKYMRLAQEISAGVNGATAVDGTLRAELAQLKWTIEYCVQAALDKEENLRTELEKTLLRKLGY